MNKLLILLVCFVFFASCGKRLIEVEKKDDNGLIIEKYYLDKDSFKFGTYTSFDSQGKLFEKSHYNKGLLDGERIIYFPSGTKEVQENYVLGIYQGPYFSYYENGKVNLEAEYIDGKMQGIVKRYYSSGELMEEVTFIDNEENGPFKEYFKNGNIKWEGNYENGDHEIGIIKGYDEQGNLIKKMDCGKYNGEYICQTIWTIEEGDKEMLLKYDL